jgi:hypothetical protein
MDRFIATNVSQRSAAGQLLLLIFALDARIGQSAGLKAGQPAQRAEQLKIPATVVYTRNTQPRAALLHEGVFLG